MKKLILLIAIIATTTFACKKDKSSNSTNGTVTGTWTIKTWDGVAVAAGSIGLQADGSYGMQVTFSGGGSASAENGTYVKSGNTLTFTKTSGVNYMAGGNSWTINTSDAHNLKITSQFGLVVECTK